MILYINTSGKYCELVLLNELEIIDFIINKEELSHSAHLHDLIKSILEKNCLGFENLKAIAVLNGPGSYTGLRIGLSAAKGFCFALEIPLILLNQMTLFCNYYIAQNKKQPAIAAIKHARAGEYFLEVQFNDDGIQNISPCVQTQEYIDNLIQEHANIKFIGPKEGIPEIEGLKIEPLELPYTHIAKEIDLRLKMKETDDLFGSEPFYLKKVHVNTPKKRF